MESISFDVINEKENKTSQKRARNTYVLMNEKTRLEIFNRLMATKNIGKRKLVSYYSSLRKKGIKEPLNYEELAFNLGMDCDLFKCYISAYSLLHPRYKTHELVYKVYNKLARDLRYPSYTEGDTIGFYDAKHKKSYEIDDSYQAIYVNPTATEPSIKPLSKEDLIDRFIYLNHPNEELEVLKHSTKFSYKNEVISIKQILEEKSILGWTLSDARLNEVKSIYNRIYDKFYDLKNKTEDLTALQDLLNLPVIYSIRCICNSDNLLYTDDQVKNVISKGNADDTELEAWEIILCSNIDGIADIRKLPIKLNQDAENTKPGIYPVDKYIIASTYSYPLPDLNPFTVNKIFNCRRVLELIKSAN